MTGFIQLHRRIINWEWYDDHNTTRLFIHLLLKINHKDKIWRGIRIPAGSFLTGRKELSKETGLSEQQVRTSLDKLKSTNEITIKTTKKFSIITMVKWTSYQSYQPTKQPSDNQVVTTTNNDNNDNNILPPIVPQKGERKKRQGMRIEKFFKSEYPDEFEKNEIGCPQDWGEMAMSIYHERREQSSLDLVKEINWEFDKFYDFFASSTRTTAIKKDWKAAWRNWWKNKAEVLAKQEERDEIFKNRYGK